MYMHMSHVHVLVARARSGVEKTLRGDELLARMRDQAIEYGTDYRRSHQVFLVDLEGERKTVHTPAATVHARSVVLATGAMGRSSKAFPGEDELLGKGVSYCATCDGAFYCDEEVAVVGGTHEAIEEAEFLTKFASTVHWITPNAPKADDEAAQALLALRNVRLWSRFMVESIEGDVSGVTGVRIKPRGGGDADAAEAQVLPVTGAFIYGSGNKPITDYLEEKLALKENGGVWVDEDMATSVPGVFAIGDICNRPHKQAVVAAADGCVAAMSIDKYLNGRNKVRVDWDHK